MKRKLKEELIKLSTDIITSRDMNEITDMYEAARILYEKLAVLKFIDEKLTDIEIDVSAGDVHLSGCLPFSVYSPCNQPIGERQ